MPNPNASLISDEINLLFETKGQELYGEDINQIAHALQCAQMAEEQGAEPSLIIAALLHDVGHLQHRDSFAAFQQGIDDKHELIGAKFLECRFGMKVSEPVRLHVEAKRYLCAIDHGYWEILSIQSKQTLELQGGPMNQDEVFKFAQNPFSSDAVKLRKWDDLGKDSNKNTQPLSHFLKIIQQYPRIV